MDIGDCHGLWKVVFALSASLAATTQGGNITQPENIADGRQLFVDRSLIERMDRVSLKLHEPVSGGVAIKIDKPWEGPANFGAVVLWHGGRYLMYYRAMTLDKADDSGAYCVAVSDDGVTWTKPKLGLVERAGSRDTNLIAEDTGTARFSWSGMVWLDAGPGVPENERIKAFTSEALSGVKHSAYVDPAGPKRLVMYGSADGFTFRKLARQPEILSKLPNAFDGGNTMFWSEAEQCYVLYYRFMDGYRTMARTTSKDFLHWSDPVPMTYGDTPREQFYTNNTVPYYRAPHLYVALAARFMERRRVVTDAQVKAIGMQTSHGHSYANDCSDGVLLTSRAGSTRYDRTFMEAFVRPGLGAQNWVSRTNYPLTGIFPFGKDRMMFWVSRHYMQHTWHIERLLLRIDGFASVNAPYAGGEILTKKLTFDGKEMEINYRTSAAGSVRVEIQDADGRALPGFAIADCAEIIGDEIERIVAWKGGADVARLAGQPIRLRFEMKDADLYSFRFRNNNTGTPNKPDAGDSQ
jgi:hypothetical protein